MSRLEQLPYELQRKIAESLSAPGNRIRTAAAARSLGAFRNAYNAQRQQRSVEPYHAMDYASNSNYSNRASESWGDALTTVSDDVRCRPWVCKTCKCKDYPDCSIHEEGGDEGDFETCWDCIAMASGGHKTFDRMEIEVNPFYDPHHCPTNLVKRAYNDRYQRLYNQLLQNNANSTPEPDAVSRDRRIKRKLWMTDAQRQELNRQLAQNQARLQEISDQMRRRETRRRQLAVALRQAAANRPFVAPRVIPQVINLTGNHNLPHQNFINLTGNNDRHH